MAGKVMDKKRPHAAKVLKQVARKNTGVSETKSVNQKSSLRTQYQVIREDMLRLKNDLVKGYDLAKDWLEVKTTIRGLLKSK